MKGLIKAYRGGRHTKRANQFLVEVPGVTDCATASKFIGRPAAISIISRSSLPMRRRWRLWGR